MKDLLVVSAHPADYVWRSGGVISKTIKAGARVKVIVLSYGARGESNDLWKQPGQTLEGVKRIRESESREAASCLGLTDLEFWDLEDYFMKLDSDELMYKMVEAIRAFNPYNILTHAEHDLFNPDHDAVSRFVFKASVQAISNGVLTEGYAPIRQTRIFGFEPHQTEISHFEPQVIIDITDTIEDKKNAMNCFKAQQHLIEYYTVRSFIRGNHARRISGDNSYKFAEAFSRFFPYVGEELV